MKTILGFSLKRFSKTRLMYHELKIGGKTLLVRGFFVCKSKHYYLMN